MRGNPLPSLSESRPLRLALFFLLYGAQGVTVGLFTFALPAWLAANGASAADVGAVVSAASLPWGLKFLNGFLLDRFTWLPMGRRRVWLVGAQLLLLAGFGLFALADPGVGDVAALAGFALAINFAVNFQDTATDAMATDLVPEAERARTTGMMFGGQAIALAAITVIAGPLLAQFGIRGAALAAAAYAGLVLLLVSLLRERPGERLLPWSQGAASAQASAAHVGRWGPIFGQTFAAMLRRESLLLWASVAAFGAAWGISLAVFPLMATQLAGMEQAQYSAMSGSVNLVSGLLGVLLWGMLTDRLGARLMFRAAHLLSALAVAGLLLLQDHWGSPVPLLVAVIGLLVLRVMMNIAYVALAMGLCAPAVAATQMALFAAAGNLGMTVGGAILGPIDAFGGVPAMVAAMLVMCLLGLALSLALRPAVARPPLAGAVPDQA